MRVSAALRTGFATLAKLHAFRLNSCNGIECTPGIAGRVARHSLHLAAGFIPLIPTANHHRLHAERAASSMPDIKLKHFVMQFSLQWYSCLAFSESELRQLDWSALEPGWKSLRSHLRRYLFPSADSKSLSASTIYVFFCHGKAMQPCDDQEIRQHIRNALSEFGNALDAGEEGGYWGCKEEGCRWSKRMNY